MAVLRSRNAALLFKLQADDDTPAAPAVSDAIRVEQPVLRLAPQNTETAEVTGSLDSDAPIAGGVQATLTFDSYLKGSGQAGTTPDWSDLMRACGWEVVTTTPVGPEQLASGSSSTFTLASLATASAHHYVGMPIQFAGNIATTLAFVAAYAADKSGTLTEAISGLSASTTYMVPANVLYRPTSTAALILPGTAELYMDGLCYTLTGLRGTFTLTAEAGRPFRFSWTLTGIYNGRVDAAVPAVADQYDTTRPPVWRRPDGSVGRMLIHRQPAAVRRLAMDCGNRVISPDDPNAAEGFAAAVIVSRQTSLTIDPLATLVATRDLMADLRAGTSRIVHARAGSTAGNRVAITLPAALAVELQPGDRDGLMTEEVTLRATGADRGAYICLY